MKYITVKLTEDQLFNCMQGVAWLLNEDDPKSAQSFNIRLFNKLQKALNEQANRSWQVQDPTGYLT